MEAEFWQDKWDREWIPFHRSTTNPILEKFLSQLSPSKEETILIPLCGKSVDIIYLREHYQTVVGVELVEKAVVAFFEENQLDFKKQKLGKMMLFTSGNIAIYQGDFFDFSGTEAPIDAVYDRAAFVALPEEMRKQYAEHLGDLLPSSSKILLQTIEYNQDEMLGPPFSITRSEIDNFYECNFTIETLWSSETLDKNPHLAKKGLSSLEEQVYLLQKR